jgi:nicotinate phosphoribosyltransferase
LIPPSEHAPIGAAPALFTDLYELTMVEAYRQERMTGTAVFSLFVRRLPSQRNYLLACGLESVLAGLEDLRFTVDDVDYLRSLGKFSDGLLTFLRQFCFTGDVYAVPEGTPVFAGEPLLEVVAPIDQAQLVETFVMNQIHVQTVLATKAARVVAAAQGRNVIDFGARRMHGLDAAVKGARAFYIAGIGSTSNVLAGKVYGIPLAGTLAHSYIQAHDDEREAFRAFARIFPGTTLLVDTYDSVQGVQRAIELITDPATAIEISGVRLDSGDLAALAHETRRLLDAAGLSRVEILASGGLDEHAIAALVASGAPIDGFGIGTGMGVSSDAPSLDLVYKLVEYDGKGRTKLSAQKPVLPGRKQVFRQESGGQAAADVIARWDERVNGRPLLELVMRGGRRTAGRDVDLNSIRRRAAAEMAALPSRIAALDEANPPYPVTISPALRAHDLDVHESIDV